MKFIELTEQEFRKFSFSKPGVSFAQSVEFAELRNRIGWQTEFLGVKEGDEIKLAGVVAWRFSTGIPIGDIYLGPLFDPKDGNVLCFFVRELKKYAKEKRVVYVTLSPPLVYQELTQNGDLTVSKNDELINVFRRASLRRGYDVIPRFVFKKDISQFETDDEIFKSFKTNARTNIRNADNIYRVKSRALAREELSLFKDIMEKTADRQGFNDKTVDYYENFYDIFAKSEDYTAEFVVAEFTFSELKQSYNDRKSELRELLKNAEGNIRKQYQDQIDGIERREERLREIGEQDGSTPISVGVYIKSKNEMIYLFGGNDPKYLGFGGTYIHVWQKIQEARRDGIPIFNFYGVSGIFDKNDKSYGVLEYKQSFNGYIEELVGGFYLTIHPVKHFLIRILSQIKKIFYRDKV